MRAQATLCATSPDMFSVLSAAPASRQLHGKKPPASSALFRRKSQSPCTRASCRGDRQQGTLPGAKDWPQHWASRARFGGTRSTGLRQLLQVGSTRTAWRDTSRPRSVGQVFTCSLSTLYARFASNSFCVYSDATAGAGFGRRRACTGSAVQVQHMGFRRGGWGGVGRKGHGQEAARRVPALTSDRAARSYPFELGAGH